MKTSFIAILAFFGLFIGALSVPTVEVQRRASIDQATAIVTDLYAQIQAYTGAINATTAGISPASSIADKAAAEAKVASSFTDITNAVIAATGKVTALPKRSLEARQAAPGDLATIVAMVLAEIFGALNNVIATLGLSGFLGGALGPLLSSLSGLLIALRGVVDQLLILVKQLLDGLLTGLAAGLAGLII